MLLTPSLVRAYDMLLLFSVVAIIFSRFLCDCTVLRLDLAVSVIFVIRYISMWPYEVSMYIDGPIRK